MKLPLDITRCTNSDCKESLNCKRFLVTSEEYDNDTLIWCTKFDEKDCEFKIKKDEYRT